MSNSNSNRDSNSLIRDHDSSPSPLSLSTVATVVALKADQDQEQESNRLDGGASLIEPLPSHESIKKMKADFDVMVVYQGKIDAAILRERAIILGNSPIKSLPPCGEGNLDDVLNYCNNVECDMMLSQRRSYENSLKNIRFEIGEVSKELLELTSSSSSSFTSSSSSPKGSKTDNILSIMSKSMGKRDRLKRLNQSMREVESLYLSSFDQFIKKQELCSFQEEEFDLFSFPVTSLISNSNSPSDASSSNDHINNGSAAFDILLEERAQGDTRIPIYELPGPYSPIPEKGAIESSSSYIKRLCSRRAAVKKVVKSLEENLAVGAIPLKALGVCEREKSICNENSNSFARTQSCDLGTKYDNHGNLGPRADENRPIGMDELGQKLANIAVASRKLQGFTSPSSISNQKNMSIDANAANTPSSLLKSSTSDNYTNSSSSIPVISRSFTLESPMGSPTKLNFNNVKTASYSPKYDKTQSYIPRYSPKNRIENRGEDGGNTYGIMSESVSNVVNKLKLMADELESQESLLTGCNNTPQQSFSRGRQDNHETVTTTADMLEGSLSAPGSPLNRSADSDSNNISVYSDTRGDLAILAEAMRRISSQKIEIDRLRSELVSTDMFDDIADMSVELSEDGIASQELARVDDTSTAVVGANDASTKEKSRSKAGNHMRQGEFECIFNENFHDDSGVCLSPITKEARLESRDGESPNSDTNAFQRQINFNSRLASASKTIMNDIRHLAENIVKNNDLILTYSAIKASLDSDVLNKHAMDVVHSNVSPLYQSSTPHRSLSLLSPTKKLSFDHFSPPPPPNIGGGSDYAVSATTAIAAASSITNSHTQAPLSTLEDILKGNRQLVDTLKKTASLTSEEIQCKIDQAKAALADAKSKEVIGSDGLSDSSKLQVLILSARNLPSHKRFTKSADSYVEISLVDNPLNLSMIPQVDSRVMERSQQGSKGGNKKAAVVQAKESEKIENKTYILKAKTAVVFDSLFPDYREMKTLYPVSSFDQKLRVRVFQYDPHNKALIMAAASNIPLDELNLNNDNYCLAEAHLPIDTRKGQPTWYPLERPDISAISRVNKEICEIKLDLKLIKSKRDVLEGNLSKLCDVIDIRNRFASNIWQAAIGIKVPTTTTPASPVPLPSPTHLPQSSSLTSSSSSSSTKTTTTTTPSSSVSTLPSPNLASNSNNSLSRKSTPPSSAIIHYKEEFGRSSMAKFDRLLTTSNLSIEEWFRSSATNARGFGLKKKTDGKIGGGKLKLTMLELSNSISHLCRNLNLPAWRKKDLSHLHRYIDTNADTDLTLGEVISAFNKYRTQPGHDSNSGSKINNIRNSSSNNNNSNNNNHSNKRSSSSSSSSSSNNHNNSSSSSSSSTSKNNSNTSKDAQNPLISGQGSAASIHLPASIGTICATDATFSGENRNHHCDNSNSSDVVVDTVIISRDSFDGKAREEGGANGNEDVAKSKDDLEGENVSLTGANDFDGNANITNTSAINSNNDNITTPINSDNSSSNNDNNKNTNDNANDNSSTSNKNDDSWHEEIEAW